MLWYRTLTVWKHTAQRHSWVLESRIEDLKSRIYQASHKHIMNTYLPCIMPYTKLMVCHPRLYIVGVALKWKKKKFSYNADVRINSQSGTLPWLWQGWDGQGPLLLQSPTTSAAAICSYITNMLLKFRMEISSPSRHFSCEQGLAESRLRRHAMDEMLILVCLTPEETELHTNHVVQDTGSGCRENGSFA